MTISYTSISALLTQAQSPDDNPMLIATNAAEQYLAVPKWDDGATPDYDTADAQPTGEFATTNAHDRKLNTVTKAAVNPSAEMTTQSLVFKLDAGSTRNRSFDVIMVYAPNISTVGCNSITIKVSETADFTGAATIASYSPTPFANNKRIIWKAIGTSAPERLDTVPYVAVIFDGMTHFPVEVGQVVLGYSHQLSYPPIVGYNDHSLNSTVEDFVTDSGVISRYTKSSGQKRYSASWDLTTNSRYGFDDIATVKAFWEDCDYGSLPFLIVEKPESEKFESGKTNVGHWVYAEPQMDFPIEGPNNRTFNLEAVESAPFVLDD